MIKTKTTKVFSYQYSCDYIRGFVSISMPARLCNFKSQCSHAGKTLKQTWLKKGDVAFSRTQAEKHFRLRLIGLVYPNRFISH